MTAAADMRSALALARAGDRSGAWRLASSGLDNLARDREAALAFAELLAVDPAHPDVLAPAERIVAAWGSDSTLMIALCASLVRVAEQRPADEPPFEKGPAHLAAGAAQRCFDGLDAVSRRDPAIGGYLQINLADALRIMGPAHDTEALQAYQLALAIDGDNGWWWFQLGLLHKWRGRFGEARDCNRRARARLGDLRPVLWNLALAATALGDGQTALDAWAGLGIRATLSGGGLPFVAGMPPMQLRVATLGEDTGRHDPLPPEAVTFEVLWVQPLSPCHGVVQSATVRRASVDYGDLVLWDGAPVHFHTIEGRSVPVFPLLWILRLGDEKRLRFVGMEKARGLIENLAAQLGDSAQLALADLRASEADGAGVFYGKLLVASGQDLLKVRTALERTLSLHPGISLAIPALYELLGDTPAAGKAHQAWGGIERAAAKLGLLPRD